MRMVAMEVQVINRLVVEAEAEAEAVRLPKGKMVAWCRRMKRRRRILCLVRTSTDSKYHQMSLVTNRHSEREWGNCRFVLQGRNIRNEESVTTQMLA